MPARQVRFGQQLLGMVSAPLFSISAFCVLDVVACLICAALCASNIAAARLLIHTMPLELALLRSSTLFSRSACCSLDCGRGEFQNVTGQSSCFKCPKGTFQARSGNDTCS